MKVCIIAAAAENGVIGKDNDLPWRIESEWQYFKRITLHKPCIMGRKTFESLSAPLKNRPNIVISRNKDYTAPGAIVVHRLEDALARAKDIAAETGVDEIMVMGGAEIYRLALPCADRLYLTEVHMSPEGGAHFPAFDRAEWTETKSEFHKAQQGETADYTIRVFERKK